MDGLSFEPPLNDASASEWTKTTWGTPGEDLYSFIGVQGWRGYRSTMDSCQLHSLACWGD